MMSKEFRCGNIQYMKYTGAGTQEKVKAEAEEGEDYLIGISSASAKICIIQLTFGTFCKPRLVKVIKINPEHMVIDKETVTSFSLADETTLMI